MISNLWIKTCAARYEQKGGVLPDGAIALASACAELQQVEIDAAIKEQSKCQDVKEK